MKIFYPHKNNFIKEFPVLYYPGIFLFVMLQLGCSAQEFSNHKIQFSHFSFDRGLPQTYFDPIIQDRKGYMWFGTRNGLIKYDGYVFTTFQYDPLNKNSLPTNFANHLCEDSLNNIWIAGDYGLTKFDQRKGVFINFLHDKNNKFSIPSDNVSCLSTDRQGTVWIGTDNGLCFYDYQSGKFINLNTTILSDSLYVTVINYLMMDHDGLLWIATSEGINIYNPSTKKITLFQPDDKSYLIVSKEINCLMEDHSGEIWMGLGEHGIYRYNPKTKFSKVYLHSKTDSNSIGSDDIDCIFEDSHHIIWCGGYESGLNIYNRETDNFKVYHADVDDIHSLNCDHIMNVREDRSGVIWIGTNGGGLNTCNPYQNKFTVYKNWDKKYLSRFSIGLYKDHTGKIYMSTFGTGVQEFNSETGTFKSYKVVLPNDKINSLNFCFGTLEDSNGDFWVTSYDEGLHKLNRETGKFTTIHTNAPHGNQINCITEDFDKRLWLGTNQGLKCYDLNSKIFCGFEKLYHDTNQLGKDAIVCLYFDADSILWIGGTSGGLTLLNTKTGAINFFSHSDNNPHSLSNNAICSFFDAGNGKMWVGTGGGLNILNKKTGEFDMYTIKDGLPDNSVNGILEDNNHNFWLSTNNGICKLTFHNSSVNGKLKRKITCRNFNMSDGLPGGEFYWSNCLKGNDGTLYFGSLAGLVAIKPDQMNYNKFIPPVLITSLQVLNKSVLANDTTSILKVPVDETKEISLSYKQNIFSFAFSALSFIHPEKNQFAYMLEGFDKNWIYTDATKRFATYTNLEAGKYIFKVKASNNDGMWNNSPEEIKIIITPPFWQTWWFKCLVTIGIAIAAYFVVQSRLQKVKDISRIRNKIASDLHDDLGATLSSISIMSEIVHQQVKQKSPQSVAILEKIGTSSRNMIDSLNDMVWAINPKNDNFENIIKRMKTFASEILAARDINFNFDFDKNLLQSKLKMDTRRNFYLIFKEAVNNIAKYSGAMNAYVLLHHCEDNLKMIIRDDGNGFDLNKITLGNGLNNMAQRAEEMKAKFNLETFPGKGTKVELEFKNES